MACSRQGIPFARVRQKCIWPEKALVLLWRWGRRKPVLAVGGHSWGVATVAGVQLRTGLPVQGEGFFCFRVLLTWRTFSSY